MATRDASDKMSRDTIGQTMKKVIQLFGSFEEAKEADKKYYRSLTPNQRIALLLKLRDHYRPYSDEFTERFERVYRIVKRA